MKNIDKIKIKGLFGLFAFVLGLILSNLIPGTSIYNEYWLICVSIIGIMIFGGWIFATPYLIRLVREGE